MHDPHAVVVFVQSEYKVVIVISDICFFVYSNLALSTESRILRGSVYPTSLVIVCVCRARGVSGTNDTWLVKTNEI